MLNKKIIKDYFSFSRRDRIAILILTGLIIILYCFPYFLDRNQLVIIRPDGVLAQAVDTLEAQKSTSEVQADLSHLEPLRKLPEPELFKFDPNTISVEGWQRLGLNEKTGRTIEKYRLKGGRFYQPEDLQKIWGLPKGFYERVKDHITIKSIEKTFEKPSFEKPSFQKTEKKIIKVHINDSDTVAFIALPGIGSKLAARIISFREKLGGFYSIEQIKETYGLPDSIFLKIKPFLIEGGEIKKIKINEVTKDELKKHPYFKWNIVNAIIEYRNQHGPFKNINDLKNIVVIDENTFQKIANYLSL